LIANLALSQKEEREKHICGEKKEWFARQKFFIQTQPIETLLKTPQDLNG